jgi:hypothetical protein
MTITISFEFKQTASPLPNPHLMSLTSYDTVEKGGDAGPRPMSTAVHRSPNKLWRSNSIFNLCSRYNIFHNFFAYFFDIGLSQPRMCHYPLPHGHKTYDVYDRCFEMIFKEGLMRTVIKLN